MLSFFIADDQNSWDKLLLHTKFVRNINVCRGTRLAPNGIHIGRYPTLPMIILEGSGAKGHQSKKQDQLEFIELLRYRPIRAYNLMREETRLLKAKHEAPTKVLVQS